MIGYIKGKLIWFEQNKAILEANGVGYEINYLNVFTFSELNNVFSLYVVQKFSEYGVSFYGFETIEEKLIFEALENIKGIGSKTIFIIMSNLKIKKVSDLHGIKLDDLIGLPGIGKSTAQKFLLALSNKIKKEFEFEKEVEHPGNSLLEKKYKNEIDLLTEWGMRKNDIVNLIKSNIGELEGLSSEKFIKFALKNLKS